MSLFCQKTWRCECGTRGTGEKKMKKHETSHLPKSYSKEIKKNQAVLNDFRAKLSEVRQRERELLNQAIAYIEQKQNSSKNN